MATLQRTVSIYAHRINARTAPQRQKFTLQSLVFLLRMLKMPALFSEAAA
jgi:hypothetical protein